MKALSIKQPFASLIAQGVKTVEVRSWATSYRGPILVCAGKSLHKLRPIETAGLPLGVSLSVVELLNCRPMVEADARRACLEWSADYAEHFAWELGTPAAVNQVVVSGQLGLFKLESGLLDSILR